MFDFSSELLQSHTHGCCFFTCIEGDQVNTSSDARKVQYAIVLTSLQCAEVEVHDLLTNEVANCHAGIRCLVQRELQSSLVREWVREHLGHLIQRQFLHARVD